MSKKLLSRVLVWSLLIIGLTLVTFYSHTIFVKSLEDKIVELKRIEQSTKSDILILNAQIERYNDSLYDNNKLLLMIPDEESNNNIQQKYILRPLNVADASMISFSISDTTPKNLNLSSDVRAKKVLLKFEVDDVDQLYSFINELYDSIRCVYFGNINYKLPGEKELLSGNTKKIVVQIEYFLFYNK